jgi:hypothetical protein
MNYSNAKIKKKLIRFKKELIEEIPFRFHMALILTATILLGVWVDYLLLAFGMTSIAYRYPLAIMASYLCFVCLISIYLRYIIDHQREAGTGRAIDFVDSLSDLSSVGGSVDEGSSLSGGSSSGGGTSGGGGSSVTWSGPSNSKNLASGIMMGPDQSVGSLETDSKSGGLSDIDFDVDSKELALVIIGGVIIAAVLFSGVWLIYQSPAILSEAAMQMVLATGLYRNSRQADSSEWLGVILKKTSIPFAIITLLSFSFGCVAETHCPRQHTLRSIMDSCSFKTERKM